MPKVRQTQRLCFLLIIGLLSLTLIINASLAKELDQSSQNNLTSTWILDYDFRENQYGWDWSFIQLARETYILGEGFQIERGQNVALSYIFPDLNERPININRVLIEYSFDGDNPVSINAGISADGWFSGAITPSTLTITKGDNLIAFAEGSVNEIIGAPYDRFKITWSTLNNPGSVMTIHRIRFEGTGDAPVIPNYPITNNWVVNYDFRDESHGWMSDDFTYIPNQGFSLANTKWSRRASMTSPVFPDLNGRSVRFLRMEIEYSMSGLEGGTHNINEIGFANSAGSGGLHRRQTPRLDAASNRTVTLRMNDNITLKDLTTETSGPDSFWFNWWTYSRQATLTIHQIRFAGSGDAPTSISTPCVSEGIGLFSDSCEPPTTYGECVIEVNAEHSIEAFSEPDNLFGTPDHIFNSLDQLNLDMRYGSLNIYRVNAFKALGSPTWLHLLSPVWINTSAHVTGVSGTEPEGACSELPIEPLSIDDYNIVIIDTPSRAWSANEVEQIQLGVSEVGQAFNFVIADADSPAEAFNIAMLEDSETEVLFIRIEHTDPGPIIISDYQYVHGSHIGQIATFQYPSVPKHSCFTYQQGLDGIVLRPAAIICNNALTDNYTGTNPLFEATQYTTVHELGHIFDYRTNYGLSAPLDPEEDLFELLDCTPQPNTGTIMGDFDGSWVRGRRGWGTGPAQYYRNSIARPLITDFQQNTTNNAIEAAADSFLNWVYRINATNGIQAIDPCSTIPLSSWAGPGFLNHGWSAEPHPILIQDSGGIPGTSDPSLPGDKRYFDIDNRIRQIFESE